MSVRKGPQIDRWLMRFKDVMLILGFLWALFKFFYVRPMEMQQQLDRITSAQNIQAQEMKDINRKLSGRREQE